jgi:hypothetical protein
MVFLVLIGASIAASAQSSAASTKNKDLNDLGLEVLDQTPDQAKPSRENTHPKQDSQSSGKVISPNEAKELFKSVDEILDFASRDTKLPIKSEVKRKLVDRSAVQAYIQKGMKEDRDAKRLERSEMAVAARFRPSAVLDRAAERAGRGILRSKDEDSEPVELGRCRVAASSDGA